MKFSDVMFDYHRAESVFTDALCDAGWGEYNRVDGDAYDYSIEFREVVDDCRIPEAAQKIIHDAGFHRCWTNHHNGEQWFYSWKDPEFKYTKGCLHRKADEPSTHPSS